MKFMNSKDFTYAKSVAHAPWTALLEDIDFMGFVFAAGSTYKAFETKNAGWVCFHPNTKTPNGGVAHRRLFRI